MAAPFDPNVPSTWPLLLDLYQVAAIYGISSASLRHRVKPSRPMPFTPQPFMKHPLRWRRADVERHAVGQRRTA